MKGQIYFFFLLIMMSSCAIHDGMMMSTSLPSGLTEAAYLDYAIGYSRSDYWFGIGGLNKDAQLYEARRNLMLNYSLKESESFDILTMDRKTTLFLPYARVEVLIIADVVESSGRKVTMSDRYKNSVLNNLTLTKNYLSYNEPVLIYSKGSTQKGRIIALNNKTATVFCNKPNGLLFVRNFKYSTLFKTENLDSIASTTGFRVGDEGFYKINWQSGKVYTAFGKIIGINKDLLLIETEGKLKSVLIREIKQSDEPSNSN
jgi:hypothetical protein